MSQNMDYSRHYMAGAYGSPYDSNYVWVLVPKSVFQPKPWDMFCQSCIYRCQREYGHDKPTCVNYCIQNGDCK